MSNFKSSINKCSNGSYRVDYSYISNDGTRKRTCKRGFHLQRDAIKWQRNVLPNLITELEGLHLSDETMKMEELIDEYMEYSGIRRRITTNGTKKYILEKKILPYFKGKKVYDIKPIDIEKWQNVILNSKNKSGKKYSETYIRTIRSQLTALFNYAVRLHNLPSNPMNKAEMIGCKNAEERPFWTKEQYQAFRPTVSDKTMMFCAFETLFWVGLREGELLALTYGDIDFENSKLRINKSYQRINGKDIITEPKTKSGIRTVYMPQMLTDELKEYTDSLGLIDSSTRIFPITKYGLHHALKNGCEKCNMDKIPIHSFRHSHISLLANEGNFNEGTIAVRVGHKMPGITNHYTHSYESKDKEVAEMLNGVMKKMKEVI